MSAVTEYADLEQRSEEWYEVRRGIVTASVAWKLVATKTLKVAANETVRDLTRLLVSERITGFTIPTYQSDAMMRGVLDEPLAREEYVKHHAPVKELGFMVREIAGAKLGYSPDGLVDDDGLIEIKSADPKIQLARILADEAPLEHMAQMQAGMLVSGRKWCDFISYCGGMPMFVKRVPADPAWYAAITEALAEFEKAAKEMTATYEARTEGLPITERIEHFAPVELI